MNEKEDFHQLSGFNFSEIIYSVQSHELLVKILIGYDLYDKKKSPNIAARTFQKNYYV